MRFTDGKTTWDTDAKGWNWTDWAEEQAGDNSVVGTYISDGIDNSNPVEIAGVEYSAVRILEAIDPMLLSQIVDGEIAGFGDYVKEWLEDEGEITVRTDIGQVTYRVLEGEE